MGSEYSFHSSWKGSDFRQDPQWTFETLTNENVGGLPEIPGENIQFDLDFKRFGKYCRFDVCYTITEKTGQKREVVSFEEEGVTMLFTDKRINPYKVGEMPDMDSDNRDWVY